MDWRLLRTVTELLPGASIRGTARTDYPQEIFRHHFPSFPVTPGVLLIELAAQIGGLLVQVSIREREDRWSFPVLAMVMHAKFLSFVPPDTEVEVRASLKDLRETTATCRASVWCAERRTMSVELLFAIDPEEYRAAGDPDLLRAHADAEYERLGVPWRPRAG